MQQSVGQRPVTAPVVLGVLLILVGAAALVLREAGVNFFEAVGPWGWPFFVIVPGVVLLGLSLVPAPPRGVGFATAGAIVTTVGALLLYQSRTGHWESWAYAWALLPMAAGVALALYGLMARQRGMLASGLWMTGIAALLFVVGAWFFEGIFAGESRPTDLGSWWPAGVIILGAIIALRAFLFPDRETPTPPPAEQPSPTAPPPV